MLAADGQWKTERLSGKPSTTVSVVAFLDTRLAATTDTFIHALVSMAFCGAG